MRALIIVLSTILLSKACGTSSTLLCKLEYKPVKIEALESFPFLNSIIYEISDVSNYDSCHSMISSPRDSDLVTISSDEISSISFDGVLFTPAEVVNLDFSAEISADDGLTVHSLDFHDDISDYKNISITFFRE